MSETVKLSNVASTGSVDWVQRYAPLIPHTRPVLDLACGKGRHTRYLLNEGYSVVALDKDVRGLDDILGEPNLKIVEADLEAGGAFPLKDMNFAGIVVVNYLYTALFVDLIDALAVDGVLIYQTFMRGNEAFGRPRNPNFLLKKNELKNAFGKHLKVIAFEQGYIEYPEPAMIQKICAVKQKMSTIAWGPIN